VQERAQQARRSSHTQDTARTPKKQAAEKAPNTTEELARGEETKNEVTSGREVWRKSQRIPTGKLSIFNSASADLCCTHTTHLTTSTSRR
jgi:hypothetical protein